jgi:tetratricopeptide (TPR) repeat protein
MNRLNLILTLALLCPLAHADGPGAYKKSNKDWPAALSEERAIDAYNSGYALIQKAEHAESLASLASSADARQAEEQTARRSYEAALEKFAEAVKFDASMHEAFTYIGYASRKLGRYEDSIEAYERALALYPDYPYAIEYQGEAFLALGQLDRARMSYLRLYALHPRQAAKLLRAMQAWVEAHRSTPPEGVDFESFAAWVNERAQATASDLADTRSSSW